MAEGRIYRPVVDETTCQVCSVCHRGCPAEVLPELRGSRETLRGNVYGQTALAEAKALPPCQAACPLGQAVREYVGHLSRGRWREALLAIRRENPLPAVCGTLCNHPCQEECLRGTVDAAVAIRKLKLLATRYEREHAGEIREALQGWKKPEDGRRAAVVGSGPAGLTAAYELALAGCAVTLVEGAEELGGMLSQAIPAFRFPRELLAHELSLLTGLGVRVETGRPIADADALNALRADHHAVLLACGAAQGAPLEIPGWEAESCWDALAFLRRYNRGDAPSLSGPVLVAGGGNVALDAARAAKRAGAREVTIAYRRGRADMPVDTEELAEAEAEGVGLAFHLLPVGVEREAGRVTGLLCRETEAGPRDASGRAAVVVTGRERRLPAAAVIAGVGQTPSHPFLPREAQRGDGRLLLDERGQVSGLPGLFGAGDAVSGPSYVVTAMASGRAAARNILAYLEETHGA